MSVVFLESIIAFDARAPAEPFAAYSAFTDLLLAIVPAAAFWKLQLQLKTKIGLCILMGMTALYASFPTTNPQAH